MISTPTVSTTISPMMAAIVAIPGSIITTIVHIPRSAIIIASSIHNWGSRVIISWGIEKGIKDNTRSYSGHESRPKKAPMSLCGSGC